MDFKNFNLDAANKRLSELSNDEWFFSGVSPTTPHFVACHRETGLVLHVALMLFELAPEDCLASMNYRVWCAWAIQHPRTQILATWIDEAT